MKNGKEIRFSVLPNVIGVLCTLVFIFIQLPRALSRTDNHITRCHFILFFRQGASLYRSSPIIFFLSSLLFPRYFPFPLFYTSTILFLWHSFCSCYLRIKTTYSASYNQKVIIVHDCSNPFFLESFNQNVIIYMIVQTRLSYTISIFLLTFVHVKKLFIHFQCWMKRHLA